MPLNANPLAELRDIHLPNDVSMWPLAVGWYIVIALIGLICFSIVYFFKIKWQKLKIKRIAIKQLNKWEQEIENNTIDTNIHSEISILLKRVAMTLYPCESPLKLSGDDWLRFLDERANMDAFSQGCGRALAAAPYQKKPVQDSKVIIALAKKWINRIS